MYLRFADDIVVMCGHMGELKIMVDEVNSNAKRFEDEFGLNEI